MNLDEKKIVLIVEDSTLLWSSMKRALHLSNPEVSVICVGGVEDALIYLSENVVDLIISDYFLPNLKNGFELWDHTSVKKGRIPFILISGMGTKMFLETVKDLKVCPPFLAKPFHLNQLVEMVNQMLYSKLSNQKAA